MPNTNNQSNKNQDQGNKARVDAPTAKPTDKSLDRRNESKDRVQQGENFKR